MLVIHWSHKSEAVTFWKIASDGLSYLVLFQDILRNAEHGLQAMLHVIFWACELRDVVVKVS